MTRSGVTGVTLIVLLMAGCGGPDPVPPLREDPALAAELQAETARESAARARRTVLEGMTLADAAKLEAVLVENPEDLETRGRLLAFYRVRGGELQPVEVNVAAICRHVAWVTEHHPDSILLAGVFRRADDPIGYAQIRELWLPHIEKRDAALAVLNLASYFFSDEPKVAEGLLLRMQELPLDPAEVGTIHDRSVTPVWGRLGGLYAQVIHSAGRPGASVEAAYVDDVKRKLAASRDAPLLAAVAQSLLLSGAGQGDPDLTALARGYLQRALMLDPEHPHVGQVWAQVESSAVSRVVANARGRAQAATYAGVPDRTSRLACFAEVEYRTRRSARDHAELTTAKALAEEALAVAPTLSADALFCDPVFRANLVLASIAWRRGDREGTLRYMSEASKAPAPPLAGIRRFPLDLEGKLTNSLLKHGERESVAVYLEEASKVRTSGDRTRMLEEATAIRDGRMPARYQRLLSMGHI